jgi:hypothetical protein
MNVVGPVVDRAELIKWWDAVSVMVGLWTTQDVGAGLQMARECQHPDARWLVSLFPAGETVTKERAAEVLLALEDDPRAMMLASEFGGRVPGLDLVARAAEMGYALAQGRMSSREQGPRNYRAVLSWAQKASLQMDRFGIYQLGICYKYGYGCQRDQGRALELFKEAAELGAQGAQFMYGDIAFGRLDWERYFWWGLSSSCPFYGQQFCEGTLRLVPSFESGSLGRVLHTVAPVFRKSVNVAQREMFGTRLQEIPLRMCLRLIELHDAMLERARQAIDCWSMAGRRHSVVKDMRVMIAKMAWEEVWRWGEREGNEERPVSEAKRSRP